MTYTGKFDSYLHMMEMQGGSFVRSLAHCYQVADTENRARLVKAFPDYFEKYQARFDAVSQPE